MSSGVGIAGADGGISGPRPAQFHQTAPVQPAGRTLAAAATGSSTGSSTMFVAITPCRIADTGMAGAR